jgi:type VI secretion system protein ImpG
MSSRDDEFVRCYLEELSWLRSMGARFAEEHPKIARRLELQPGESPDPHVERLIESFAFLTARIQADLEHDFPEIAAELLDVLYPSYLNPVPPMTIVRFVPDEKPVEVRRGTPLFVKTAVGDLCRFRTSYPVTVWPIEVTDAQFVEPADFKFRGTRPGSVFRLTLRSLSEPFEKLGVDTLRFYLSDMVVNRLYALQLKGELPRVAIVPRGQTTHDPQYLTASMVGFGEEEDVIPWPGAGHPAYRLLLEYFAFEEKFHFVDISGLKDFATGQEIELLFLLDRDPGGRVHITPESFALGCTPAVNLFETTSEPIRVDQRRIDYRLVADHRRDRSVEIHSIRSVSGSSDFTNTSREYAPFYSYTHTMDRAKQTAFWHARRVPSLRARAAGTDIFLSFHDDAFNVAQPPDEVVFAHLLCTNGALAAEVPALTPLETDEAIKVKEIINLRKPTHPLPAHLGGEALWRLVSHLSLNYLSLEGEKGAAALREILLLYCDPKSPSQRQRIDGIVNVSSDKVVHRLAGANWNGFARGTKVTVTLDEKHFPAGGAFLFAAVLSHFLGLHASVNSFTQLVVRHTGDDRHPADEEAKGGAWPKMAGGRALL